MGFQVWKSSSSGRFPLVIDFQGLRCISATACFLFSIYSTMLCSFTYLLVMSASVSLYSSFSFSRFWNFSLQRSISSFAYFSLLSIILRLASHFSTEMTSLLRIIILIIETSITFSSSSNLLKRIHPCSLGPVQISFPT